MKNGILLFVLCLIVSCNGQLEKNKTDKKEIKNQFSPVVKNEKSKQKESFGLIELRNDYIKDSLIIIYNNDNSIWKSFKYDDLFSDVEIEPFAMKPENNLLVFRTFNKEDGFYEVIVNERMNSKKFIKISDRNFKYQTLKDHILNVAFIDVNPKINPLYQEPNDKSKQLLYNKNEFYLPVKILENWLMIEDSDSHKYWVKWKDEKGELIIDWFYDA